MSNDNRKNDDRQPSKGETDASVRRKIVLHGSPQIKTRSEQVRERQEAQKAKAAKKPKHKSKKPKAGQRKNSNHVAVIGIDRVGKRLSQALVGLLPQVLRSGKARNQALASGLIFCNGKPAKASQRLRLGDTIKFEPRGRGLAAKVKDQELWNGGGTSVPTVKNNTKRRS